VHANNTGRQILQYRLGNQPVRAFHHKSGKKTEDDTGINRKGRLHHLTAPGLAAISAKERPKQNDVITAAEM